MFLNVGSLFICVLVLVVSFSVMTFAQTVFTHRSRFGHVRDVVDCLAVYVVWFHLYVLHAPNSSHYDDVLLTFVYTSITLNHFSNCIDCLGCY